MNITKPRITLALGALALIGILLFARTHLARLAPTFFPVPRDIARELPKDTIPPDAINERNLALKLPAGFSISIFAKNLPGARVMAFDTSGNMWVSRTSQGTVTWLKIGKDGGVQSQTDILKNLKNPHGLAFDPDQGLLYVAEESKIIRIRPSSGAQAEAVLDLPSGGGHYTRTIAFGPDKKLYISVGSSCNVCQETDKRRAAMLRYDLTTGKSEIIARGLRNSVFFAWQPETGKLFATEMGRDWLGDETPPDEINIIRGPLIHSSQNSIPNFGWPNCYGKNIHDTDFDKNTYIRNPCMEPFETPSFIDIPAHSAPLGLAFIPANSKWPKEYWGNLLVAYHGSWNRTSPTGYKVVRYTFSGKGAAPTPTGRDSDQSVGVSSEQDFISGWLTPEGALGRPVDILVKPDGTMYLSDDKAGVIYKIQAPQS